MVPVRRARLLRVRKPRRAETRAPRWRQRLPLMVALIRLDKQNMHPNLSPHPAAGRSLALLLTAMHLRSTALLLMLLLLHPMRTLCDSAGEMSLSVWPRTAGLCGACCLKMGNWAPLTETNWSSSFPAKGWSLALQTGDVRRSWRIRSTTSWVFVCTSVHRWDNPAVGRQCQRLLPMRIPLRLLCRACQPRPHQCRPQLLRPHLLKNRSPPDRATQMLRRTKQHQHRNSMFRPNRSMPRNPMIRRHQNLTIGILRRRPLLIRGIRLKR